MYARQSAWLNARPEKADGDKSKVPEPSRRERLKKQGIEQPDMPPCDCLHLAGYLFEIGPMVMAGMGDGPLSHADLGAWMRNTGIALNPWECRALRRASIEYCNEASQATGRNAALPWEDEVSAALDRVIQANSMRDSMRRLANL